MSFGRRVAKNYLRSYKESRKFYGETLTRRYKGKWKSDKMLKTFFFFYLIYICILILVKYEVFLVFFAYFILLLEYYFYFFLYLKPIKYCLKNPVLKQIIYKTRKRNVTKKQNKNCILYIDAHFRSNFHLENLFETLPRSKLFRSNFRNLVCLSLKEPIL